MVMDGKSKMAMAASIVWMAMATFLILGVHGESVASADTVAPTLETTTEWLAFPADLSEDTESLIKTSTC